MTDYVNPQFEKKHLYDPPIYRGYVHHNVKKFVSMYSSSWPFEEVNVTNLLSIILFRQVWLKKYYKVK